MTCRQVAELLIDYVSGELPPEQQEVLKKHLGSCPPCIFYLETYQTTIRITRELPEEPLPPALLNKLMAALDSES